MTTDTFFTPSFILRTPNTPLSPEALLNAMHGGNLNIAAEAPTITTAPQSNNAPLMPLTPGGQHINVNGNLVTPVTPLVIGNPNPINPMTAISQQDQSLLIQHPHRSPLSDLKINLFPDEDEATDTETSSDYRDNTQNISAPVGFPTLETLPDHNPRANLFDELITGSLADEQSNESSSSLSTPFARLATTETPDSLTFSPSPEEQRISGNLRFRDEYSSDSDEAQSTKRSRLDSNDQDFADCLLSPVRNYEVMTAESPLVLEDMIESPLIGETPFAASFYPSIFSQEYLFSSARLLSSATAAALEEEYTGEMDDQSDLNTAFVLEEDDLLSGLGFKFDEEDFAS